MPVCDSDGQRDSLVMDSRSVRWWHRMCIAGCVVDGGVTTFTRSVSGACARQSLSDSHAGSLPC